MRAHAEHSIISISSMRCIGIGLDQLDWDKFKLLIQERFRISPVHVVVYIFPSQSDEQNDIRVEHEQLLS